MRGIGDNRRMSESILVVGGAGYIGSHMVKQLRLVAKPREERDRIREQLSTPDLPEEVEEEKPRRRRRSSVRDED